MNSFATALLLASFVILLFLAGALWVLLRRSQAQAESMRALAEPLEKEIQRSERGLREELARSRTESGTYAKGQREELAGTLRKMSDSMLQNLATLTRANEEKLEKLRLTIEQKLQFLQEDNNRKLEQMRATVDEKLQGVLEKRLGESFKLVSERLELVHKGLGEMQTLASGVGDLKKVLTNVKTRGTWGEIQLGNLLEQVLTPEQYARNVNTKKQGTECVEFAIRLPGPGEGDQEEAVWLPIDSKFPQEDYQRLLEAQERGDLEAAEAAGRALEVRIKGCAREVREKYLNPPFTTDFAILFIPIEGLYAEVLRRPGLADQLQREHRVNITGPTTLAALLNSLQMGFRTLAIQQRSSEVWKVLGSVKSEFGKFGSVLDKVQKKLQEATNTIEEASRKTRTIERRLRNVEELPVGGVQPPLLVLGSSDELPDPTLDETPQ